MPSSATRTFTDPEMYFAGIRNLRIDGVITKCGEFRAELTHIDLHRLFMYRSDESLPRIMKVEPSGMRAGIVFATDPGEPSMLINGVEITAGQTSRNGLDWELVPSIFGALSMGLRVLDARGFCSPRARPLSGANWCGGFARSRRLRRCSTAMAEA